MESKTISRWIYQLRWWKWFLTGPNIIPFWMYEGVTSLDKESRDIVIERLDAKWHSKEPDFNGTYPNRKQDDL